MARIAYIRVSTEEQNTARQDVKFEGYDRIFTEKVSGKTANRPELQKLMDYVREGDSVTVESYSRFARNTRDLLNLVHDLDEKGVAFISLKEQIDTSTPQGRFMMRIFASLAEFEREQTLQRQAEGIAEAKKAGKYTGRKPIAIDENRLRVEAEAARAGKQTHQEAMEHLGLKPNTYYRRVKELLSAEIPRNVSDALWQTDTEVYSYLHDHPEYTKTVSDELNEISELTRLMVEHEVGTYNPKTKKSSSAYRKNRDQKLDELALKVREHMAHIEK